MNFYQLSDFFKEYIDTPLWIIYFLLDEDYMDVYEYCLKRKKLDYDGYIHWLAGSDGRQLGRIKIADSAIVAKPVIVDNTVYVYSKDGTLAALKARLF